MPVTITGINDVSDEKQAYKEIKLTLIITILLLLLYFNFKYITGESYIFFLFTSILMTIHIFRSLFSFNGNIIIILRYLLIAIPIYATSVLWFLYRGEVKTHYLGYVYQTLESTTVLVTGGFLSVLGCALGWHWGCFRFSKFISSKDNNYSNPIVDKYIHIKSKTLGIVGSSGCLIVGLLYFYINGGAIGAEKSYGQGGLSGSALFAASNIFQMFFAALALIALTKVSKDLRIYVIAVTMLGFILGILAGSRADYLFPILILFYFIFSDFRKNRSQASLESYNRKFKPTKSLKSRILSSTLIFGIIVIAYFLASAIAIWRQGSDSNIFVTTQKVLVVPGSIG